MNTARAAARFTGIGMAGSIILKMVSLFIIIYLARYLGVAEFGRFSLVLAYVSIFGAISDLGLQMTVTREMSRDKSATPKILGNALILRVILTFFAFTSSLIFIQVMSFSSEVTTYVYIAAFTIIFISFNDFYATIFWANLRNEYGATARVVSKIFYAILIMWIIVSRGNLIHVFIALVFSEILKMAITYRYSLKFVRLEFDVDLKYIKYLIKESCPLAISSVIIIIYQRIDILILSKIMGDIAVGIYSAAERILQPLMLFPLTLTGSIFPIMSRHSGSLEKRAKILSLSFKYVFIIVLPIAIGITFTADRIILLVYGEGYVESATALKILIWRLIFAPLNGIFMGFLISINKQKLTIITSLLAAITNITLNLLLIPELNYNGAAFAKVATVFVIFISYFYIVSKNSVSISIKQLLMKPVASGLLMGGFVYYFISLDLFLLIPLAAIIYFGALLALRTFSAEEINRIKSVIPVKK